LVLYRLLPIDDLLRRHFGHAGHALAILVMFTLVCIGWIFFRAPSGELLPLLGSLASWPVLSSRLGLLAIPLIVTEAIAYRRGTEFGDIYSAIPWWMRPLLFVGVFYGIIFFGARQQNEFIYFQF
jgi:alginate O-acetyltransferase complex protein AlgI